MKEKVKLYVTSACPYCRMAKDFLRERRIKFEEIDIERDPAAAREMIRKSGQMGVPVLIIDRKVIVGFDEVAIKRALRLK